MLQDLRKLDLLIIDEVGLSFGSDAEVLQLSELLNMRYEDVRPTLIVSNCKSSDLSRYLGDRGVDRLRENGGKVVTFEWESHRE